VYAFDAGADWYTHNAKPIEDTMKHFSILQDECASS
jgi:hypothetical protein